RYLNAVVTLKHTFPAGSSYSIYDQFVAIHMGVFSLRFGSGVQGGVD
ncbi:MAG: tyrosinase family protein, partial [Nitrospinaceae bacterium]|nr:tyrosinase family protein [Nitrospinaceae bacterium]NIX35516.1 tyrosinase family protein [Nitrospinaceae bacterium]